MPDTTPPAPDDLVRRAFCLVAYWEDQDLVVENYLTGGRVAATATVTGLLAGVTGFLPVHRLAGPSGPEPGTAELVRRLVAEDVLLLEGTPLERRDRAVHQLWVWGPSARYLHYHTRRARFFASPEEEAAGLAALARRQPPPPPFKDRGGARVDLPGGFADLPGGVWDVLRLRRTRRAFARTPVGLDELAAVLLWTWGKTHILEDSHAGMVVLKTSPSGGAQHPIEVYPVVLRVDGLDPGIYHYSVRWHALERLRGGRFDDLVAEMLAGQWWVRDAAAVFILTARVDRTMWKYTHAHAYRVLLLDAGHLGQTFQLVCTALGLAPFTSAAMDDELVERELGLDGVAEVPVFAAAMGRPIRLRLG